MAKDIAKGSDSSLSPPPENLQVPAETEDITKTTAVSMKRKAETTVAKTVTITKRTKKAQVADTNDNNDDAKDQTTETPRKKRATAKNIKYEEDSDEANLETTTVVKQTVKQKRTKKSKEPVLPLEDRTTDTKLRIGAHVSVAGGKLHIHITYKAMR
jgi:AP endonuclease-1